jgi:hypothetical protein
MTFPAHKPLRPGIRGRNGTIRWPLFGDERPSSPYRASNTSAIGVLLVCLVSWVRCVVVDGVRQLTDLGHRVIVRVDR